MSTDDDLAAHFDDPEALQVATLSIPGQPTQVTVAWDSGVAITQLRIEPYADRYGDGIRLGVVADATTHTGRHCFAVDYPVGDRDGPR